MTFVWILSLIFILIAVLFYFIGNYFVKYALVPSMGAEKRIIESNDDELGHQTPIDLDTKVRENFEIARVKRDQWKADVLFEQKEVRIQSYDGLTLVGHAVLNNTPTDKWLLAAHGYQSNENESTLIAQKFYDAGYNVLTFGLRAHDKSEGNYIGMGYLDKEDLIAWTDVVIEKYPESRIVYHGTSMGGATVLFAAGMNHLPQNVQAIISDCAYTSIWEMFANELRVRFNFNEFPILYMAQGVAILKAGYNIRDGNVLNYVRNSSLPILFIHSQADTFIPVEMAHRLYEAKKHGEKELFITEEGEHAEAKFAEPHTYYQRVLAFADKHLDQ